MRNNILTTQIIVMLLFTQSFFSQNENSISNKLKDIEGDISKITISTDKGDVTFEGEDAKELFNRIKTKKQKVLRWTTEDNKDFNIDSEGENIMIFKSDKGDKHIIKKIVGDEDILILENGDIDDIEILEDGKKIKVEVEEENGEKKVTVTTTEDGKEKTEVFEGKEADEYLEKMKDEHEMLINLEVEVDSEGDMIWIHKDGDKTSVKKDVKVEIIEGNKKVIVTTVTDGEEKVEVYEGEDADKYLKDEKGNKKRKKVIIKESKKTEK